MAASEGRLEESARLLASNQQVIKWLNKELNDAQMVPGGITTAAATAVAEAGEAYGGRASSAFPLGDGLGDYNFGEVDSRAGMEGVHGGGGVGSGGKDVMFTTGIRESLTGGVRWNLRGTTLDDGGEGGGGDEDGGYFSRRGGAAAAGEAVGGGESAPNRGVERTPDHAGRGGKNAGVGSGGYPHMVTPESEGVSEAVQSSSRGLSAADRNTNSSKRDLYAGGGGRDDELAADRGRMAGGAVGGIRAF